MPCNLSNGSTRNDSDFRRWAFLVAYNKKKNNPTKKHHHPQFHPLKMVPNQAIMDCNVIDSTEDKWFNNPTKDLSATSLKNRN